MNAPRPIVIGVSHRQPAAIRFALGEAKRRGASLHVVHCSENPLASTDFHRRGESVRTATGSMALGNAHEVIKREAPSQVVTYIETKGRTSEVLLGYADYAGTIVLGSGDASWLDWVRGGTVSGVLVRDSHCPVVSVPEGCGSMNDGSVVVAIDGDSSAVGPLSYGFEQARLRHTSLTILHSVPVGAGEADVETHRANLAEVVAGWKDLFPDVEMQLSTVAGDAVGACVGASSSSSLVVVGRPHGSVGSFALARPVAMSVMRRTQCAVAIVDSVYEADDGRGSSRGTLVPVVA